MPSITLYVDESGEFEPPRRAPWAQALRVIAAVAMPGDKDASEGLAGEILAASLRDAGLAWLEGDVHASELTSPDRFAPRCAACPDAPPSLRAAARRLAERGSGESVDARARELAWRELKAAGHGALHALRRAIGRRAEEHGAVLTLVSEYGYAGGALPYGRMLRELLGQAALRVSLEMRGEIHIGAVVASREGFPVTELSVDAWSRRLAAMEAALEAAGALGQEPQAARIRWGGPVTLARAETRAGLQIADVFAHAFGPGASQSVTPSADEVRRRTLASLAERARICFGWEGAEVAEFDALDGSRASLEALGAFPGEGDFVRALERGRRVGRPLPAAGTYPSAREQLGRTLEGLEDARAALAAGGAR